VDCVAFSGDGHFIASGSSDGAVKLWDAATGLCLHTFHGHPAKIVTFSPDSRFCASASSSEIRIWGVHTCTLISTLKTPSDVIKFSPDSSQLLSLGMSHQESRNLTLWEAKTGSLLAEVQVDRVFDNVAFGVYGIRVILQSRQTHSVETWRLSRVRSSGHNLPTRINGNNQNSSLPMVFVPVHDGQQRSTSPPRHRYNIRNGWILDGKSRRVLWVPPNSRSHASDCCGEKIVMGCSTGKLAIVDFQRPS